MFLGAYHFDGDTAALLPRYDRLRERFPDELPLHVCVSTPRGLTVFDACPDAARFTAFSTDPGFLGLVADAGLPVPRVEPIGPVHAVVAAPAAGSGS